MILNAVRSQKEKLNNMKLKNLRIYYITKRRLVQLLVGQKKNPQVDAKFMQQLQLPAPPAPPMSPADTDVNTVVPPPKIPSSDSTAAAPPPPVVPSDSTGAASKEKTSTSKENKTSTTTASATKTLGMEFAELSKRDAQAKRACKDPARLRSDPRMRTLISQYLDDYPLIKKFLEE